MVILDIVTEIRLLLSLLLVQERVLYGVKSGRWRIERPFYRKADLRYMGGLQWDQGHSFMQEQYQRYSGKTLLSLPIPVEAVLTENRQRRSRCGWL